MHRVNRKPNTKCSFCQKEIYRKPNEIKKSNGKNYCSRQCYGKSIRVEIPCQQCGILILSGINRKTCSDECYEEWLINPNREFCKGRKKQSTSINRRSFRKEFFSIRGTNCEFCGFGKYDILNIHHIIERSEGGTDDLENLLLLCPNCHAAIHKGFIDNNGRLTESSIVPVC